MHILIPIALADCVPGPTHSDPDGRAWYGHADTKDPISGEWQSASWRLDHEPDPLDTHWVAFGAIPSAPAEPPARDLDDLGLDEHPSLSAADRNPSMVGR